ncbi:MAG: DUF1553 domain-containing protein, partial [Bryobacteraceae bacterium]
MKTTVHCLLLTAGVLAAAPVDFNRDIRPILSDNCFACHGPDSKQRMAELRLDNREGAFASRQNHPVIVPGNSSASPLFKRISTGEKGLRMPPVSTGMTLTPRQIELFRAWIDQGAKWDSHWSYAPPKRSPLPSVKLKSWTRNAIDSFVLARLEQEGLAPSPETDKPTLLRRVTYDLTGLPPAPSELDAFLADLSPSAYDKVVDRLLKSPRYGERMAMQWLDLARYSDTHGYHIDSQRDMWPWRDWVIQAFNGNMPFDKFTIEQIAGDLLPEPTREQRIATGFNRNHMINFEGGAIPEEYQTEYVVDRVETTSTVWMGMTLGCARCHDHKYDPIKQQDFYQFFAFFNTIPEKGLDGRTGNAEPLLQLPDAAQEPELIRLKREIKAREAEVAEKRIGSVQNAWEKKRVATLPDAPRQGLVAHYELDGHLADTSGGYQHARAVRGDVTFADGPFAQSGVLSGESQLDFGVQPQFDRSDAFSIAVWMKLSGQKSVAFLQKIDEGRRGIELVLDDPVPVPDLKRGVHISFRMSNRWPENALEVQTTQRYLQNAFLHVAVTSDGSGKAAGIRMFVDGVQVAVNVLHDSLSATARTATPWQSGNKQWGLPFKGQLADLRFFNRAVSAEEIDQLALRYPIRGILSTPAVKRSKDNKDKLRDYFLTYEAPEKVRAAYADLKSLRVEKAKLDKIVPNVMVMDEMEKPRDSHILARGDYRNKGSKVEPAVPGMLPPLPPNAPNNRLGLAEWLVSPSHPLTARVAVNRYWQMYFGTGLVKTAEDFGSQGEAPSHPELLDWLATEFVRTGWDVRAMQRLIVSSAAYRQSSKVSPALLEKDPENRLLARGARFRLPAEMVRDNALAVSGLLVEKLGGPSVFPYQPKGLWEDIAYGDVYSAQSYSQGSGKDLYRRSMYTFWKRTSPPPSLATFDAPDREKCTARRTRTNTPLQALVLLNDPTYVEAARALAQRVITEAGPDPAKRITLAYRLALARKPAPPEAQVLRDLAEQQTATYRKDKDAATKLL